MHYSYEEEKFASHIASDKKREYQRSMVIQDLKRCTVNKLVSSIFSKPGEKNYSGESRSRVICPLLSANHELPVKYSLMRFFFSF